MIIPLKLVISDFLSIESATYEFQNGVPVLIRGENLTNNGQKSNGSGKSSFEAAIDYAINGSVARKVRDNELVRRGQSEAVISLFLKQSIDGKVYSIERTIRVKGSSSVEVEYFEGDDYFPVEKSSVPEFNKYIYDVIFKGILRQDINDYFILNEINYKPFFMKSDTDKKVIMSRFSNADLVDPVFDEVQSKKEEIEVVLAGKDSEMKAIEAIIGSKKNDLFKEESRDLKEEKREIENSILGSITAKSDSIDDTEELIEGYVAKVNLALGQKEAVAIEIQDLMDEIDDSQEVVKAMKLDIEEEDKGLLEKKNERRVLSHNKGERVSEQGTLIRAKNNYVAIIKGAIECPKCKHKFSLSSDMSIDEVITALDKTNESIENLGKTIEEIEAKYKDASVQLEEMEVGFTEKTEKHTKFKRQLDKFEDELSEVKRKKTRLVADIENLSRKIIDSKDDLIKKRAEIKMLNDELATIKMPSNIKAIKELKTEIKVLEDDLIVVEDSTEIEVEKLEKLESWVVNFTMFKNFLINRKLKVIQSMINSHLKNMNSDISISIEGFKILSNGKIREKITPIIIFEGEAVSYGSLSKGEKTRVDIATLVSKQDLINQTVECGGFDLLFMDEVLEGLDGEGLALLMKSLYGINRTTLITTHNNEDGIHDKIVKFIKERGITRLELEYD